MVPAGSWKNFSMAANRSADAPRRPDSMAESVPLLGGLTGSPASALKMSEMPAASSSRVVSVTRRSAPMGTCGGVRTGRSSPLRWVNLEPFGMTPNVRQTFGCDKDVFGEHMSTWANVRRIRW